MIAVFGSGGRIAFLLLTFLSATFCQSTKHPIVGAVAFSPDAKSIAFSIDTGDSSFIYLADPNGKKAKRLTDTKQGYESAPSFSPNGQSIAFSYSNRRMHGHIRVVDIELAFSAF